MNDVMNELEMHTVNYRELLVSCRSIFMYFVLGYLQDNPSFKDQNIRNISFCNISQNFLSFTVIDERGEGFYYYYISRDFNLFAYETSLRTISSSGIKVAGNDCILRDQYPHLIFCSRYFHRSSVQKLEASCMINGVQESETKFASFWELVYNRTITKLESRVTQTAVNVFKFLQTNHGLQQNLQANVAGVFLLMTLGNLLSYYKQKSSLTISVGTNRGFSGHSILVCHKFNDRSEKTEYISLRSTPEENQSRKQQQIFNYKSFKRATELVQIDLVTGNEFNEISPLAKLTRVETSKQYQALRLVQYIRRDTADKILVNLSELFKRLYQSTQKCANVANWHFFIGFFLAWRTTIGHILNLETNWYENAQGGIFFGIHVKNSNSSQICYLVKSEIFRHHIDFDHVSSDNAKNPQVLHACYMTTIAKHGSFSRITQIWKPTMFLQFLMKVGNPNLSSYNFNQSTVENLEKVVPPINFHLLNTLDKHLAFSAGYLAYYHDVEVSDQNVLKIVETQSRANKLSSLIVFRDTVQEKKKVKPLSFSEKCTKTNIAIFEINFTTRTFSTDDSNTKIYRAKKYCAKQKTTMSFLKENGTFSIQQHDIFTKKFEISPLSQQPNVSDLVRNVQMLGSMYSTNVNIWMMRKDDHSANITIILLDPMSHQVLLSKSVSVAVPGKMVQVYLEPQKISRKFDDYEFISLFLGIQRTHNRCPTKTTYTGIFFRDYSTKNTTILMRKFTSNTIEWFGLTGDNNSRKWQSFCTSYDYKTDSTADGVANLNQISKCKNSTVLAESNVMKRNYSQCTISHETLSRTKGNKGNLQNLSNLLVDIDMENNLDIINEYLSGSVTFRIFQKSVSHLTLVTPERQAVKINHQILLLDILFEDIMSIRYTTRKNVKHINVHTTQLFSIAISIENYKNNFAFHVIKTTDNYAIIVHPITKIFMKIDQKDDINQDDVIDGLVEQFSVIRTQPGNFVAFHLSNNELHKAEKSMVINWIKNDVDLETRLGAGTENWVLEVDARCTPENELIYCDMEPINVETDTFNSPGLKIITLKALCWKLKEYHAELIIKVDQLIHKNETILLSLLVKSVLNVGMSYLGKITLSSKATPLTKVYLELEYIQVLAKVLGRWTLSPYKLNLPENVRWLVLQPESLARPVSYKMRRSVTNFEYLRVNNSILFKFSIVSPFLDQLSDTDHLYVLCFSYYDVEHAFPKIVLEFTNEIFFIEKQTSFRTFYM